MLHLLGGKAEDIQTYTHTVFIKEKTIETDTHTLDTNGNTLQTLREM